MIEVFETVIILVEEQLDADYSRQPTFRPNADNYSIKKYLAKKFKIMLVELLTA